MLQVMQMDTGGWAVVNITRGGIILVSEHATEAAAKHAAEQGV